MIAPASRSFVTTNASGARAASSAGEPAVVADPATWTLSLTSTGMPSSKPRGRPDSSAASLSAACSSASGHTVITARNEELTSAIRSRCRCVSPVAVRLPSASAWRSPATMDDSGLRVVPGICGVSSGELWKSGMAAE